MGNFNLLQFLYETYLGRILLKPLISKKFSKLSGKFMDSNKSRILIKPFIKTNNINMKDFKKNQHYQCFNDFFTRKISNDARDLGAGQNEFCAPSDGLLSIYNITSNTVLPVKGSAYTISDLIQDKTLAQEFNDGLCLVFRLCVNHYHRYHYLDTGKIISQKYIEGVFHTVRPIALRNVPVFKENARELMLLNTDNFGPVAQIEVGAMMVGKISNNHTPGYSFKKFEEKGMFLYGGSTVILLVKKDAINLRNNLLYKINSSEETDVKLGEVLGFKKQL